MSTLYVLFPVYLLKPWVNLGTMARLTVYRTHQGVQGIVPFAVSVVLGLQLWVLLMYCRQNLSSYGFLGYKYRLYRERILTQNYDVIFLQQANPRHRQCMGAPGWLFQLNQVKT